MKYDDAEHIMAELEKAYPNSPIEVQSHATYSNETHDYTGPRSYTVTAKFPQGIDLDNIKPIVDLYESMEGITATMLNGQVTSPLRVLFASEQTTVGGVISGAMVKGP